MEPTYSADTALADALSRLKAVEDDNRELRYELIRIQTAQGSEKELARLRKQNDELMHVNGQWDIEFRETDEAFRHYRRDSQLAQEENQTVIEKLKEKKEKMAEEIQDLYVAVNHKNKEIGELKAKLKLLQESMVARGNGKVVRGRVRELEEESHFLRQQLKTYQDDFNAERKDRERLNEEKESSSVRYEAEITSLKLQLERCRHELAHYTAEANRLSQQLRLKSQYEEEQYKKHLESRGYITRGTLPPLDPFVEIDVEHPIIRTPPQPQQNTSPRLLTRGVDVVQAYAKIQGSRPEGSNSPKLASHYSSQEGCDRSRSPIGNNGNGTGVTPPRYFGMGNNVQQQTASSSSSSSSSSSNLPRTNAFQPSIPPSMINASSTSSSTTRDYMRHNGTNIAHHYGNTIAEGNGSSASSNGISPAYQEQVIGRTNAPLLPIEMGKFSCPRCERKFSSRMDFNDHKTRCMI